MSSESGERFRSLGVEVPGYELLASLGSGGGGVAVYKARALGSGQLCALRVLPTPAPQTPALVAALQRFLADGKRLLGFSHPHVAKTYDAGSAEGCAWIAQELVDGPSLEAWLERADGPLPVAAALAIGIQLGGALDALAAAQVVHRDVSPRNVMVSVLGQTKLCDSGIESALPERLSLGHVPLTTVDFMSPEQVDGDVPLTPRSDVYGLGATLYRALAGRTPYSGTTLFARLRSIVHDAPPDLRELNPDVPDALAEMIGRFMERDPDDRPLPQDTAVFLDRIAQRCGLRGEGWEAATLAALVPGVVRTLALASPPAAAPSADGPPVLVRLRGTDRTIERTLAPGQKFELGRAHDAEVPLPFGWISRRHARVERRPDGVFLVDLGSANGVVHNKARLRTPAALRTGDLIALGKSKFEVTLVEGASEAPLERRCVLCGQTLAARGGDDGETVCARCQTRAESDRIAGEGRIRAALEAAGFKVKGRLQGSSLLKRFFVRSQGAARLVSAIELGTRTAESFAEGSRPALELRHPAIAPVLDVQVRAGILLVVQDAPDGVTLEARVEHEGALSPIAVARLGRRLAEGAGHALDHGVRHLRVRPDLVLLTPEGEGLLLDAGLAPSLVAAARYRVGVDRGVPCFEASGADEGDVTPQGVVYALGATLSFALTGSPVAEVRRGERYDHLPLTMVAGIPQAMAFLLARATAPEPRDRPQTPLALRDALEALIGALEDSQTGTGDDMDDDETTRPIDTGDLPPQVLFDR